MGHNRDMKPDSSLPKLPTVGELLKHPKVREIVQRVNQTTIAQRAAGFLESLQANLQDWTAKGIVPTVHELAERLAQRLLGRTGSLLPVINATGVVLGDRWSATPLAEAAVHEMLRTAGEFQELDSALNDRLQRLVGELTGAESAWATSSLGLLAHIARECDDQPFVQANLSGLVDPVDFGLTPVATIQSQIAGGTELLLIEASGLLGGPRCGIALGRRSAIEALKAHPLAVETAANSLTLSALVATLEVYRKQEIPAHQIPVLQLLSTPLENLQQRAQRLAPLMAEGPGVRRAEARQCVSTWCDQLASQSNAASWAVALQWDGLSASDVAERLQDGPQPIAVRVEQETMMIDLRSVFPRWDQELVSAVVCQASGVT